MAPSQASAPAASSRPETPLDLLLEESRQPSTSPQDDLEPVPTLSSLLLSTAASLAERSRQPTATTSKPALPPSFALPASPQALLSDPNSTQYLASLLGLPLPSLKALPSSLATLSTSLDTDLSSLAFTRYSAFLLSHAATKSISNSFSALSASLGSLLDSTSALEVASGAFESRVHDVRRKRERMARVRERMEEVEELLEASSVVDACVRAGYWTEALDVAGRLAELHARLSSSKGDTEDANAGKGALVLLDRVRDEVSLALLALRARVLESLLQRSLKLPAAVRGMAILRRMNAGGLGLEGIGASSQHKLEEEALRIVFLAARWRCLRAELDSVEGQMAAAGIKLVSTQATSNGTVPAPSPDDGIVGVEENDERTRWAKRWIELWREVIGETIGMYTEVFLATPSTSHSVDEPTEDSLSATAPLSLFLSSSLSSLTTTLLQTLPALTSTSSLSSILTQLSYCSHSFARFGLEFREIEQIRERVEQRVGVIIAGDLETAGYRWEKEWRDGWEGGIRRRGKERKAMAQWLVVAEGLATALATPLPPPPEQTASDAWHHQPSPSLSLLPPLARFLNAHATALNSLRLLPAISLFPVLRKAQGRALDRATQVLSAFVDAWASSVEAHIPPSGELSNEEIAAEAVRADEKKLIIFAIAAFGRWVVPWCEGALRVGVYAELKGMEDSVGTALAQEAMRKAEALIAKVQGREASVEVGGLPTPTDIEQPGLNQVPSAPPPSLEPELDLPPSLDPSVDAPPPSATEISFEPSLEPTLERTQELVEDSAPKSLVPEAVEEAVVSPPEPEPELPADKSAEGYAVEEDELPAKEIELTKDNVLNGKGHESTSEDLSIPPIEPPPEIATLVDTAPSENGPTGKLKTNGDAKEGPRVVSEGVVEAGEINGAVTLE